MTGRLSEAARRRNARLGVFALAVPTMLVGLNLGVATTGANAAVIDSNGTWRWEGTATTVGNARESLRISSLPPTAGSTGKGVGIALIDTGVAPVPGLSTGNVVNGPDLSLEGQDPARRHVDGFGHGTHLAGIISARTPQLTGLAPEAKLTSVKVGTANGAVDVSQVIAALDWVVAHRNDDPKNPIRVLTLAYGTDGVQKREIDPLAHAVENAWRAGIVVVVAGGNRGGATKLLNPATDPFVIAVGAQDDNGTATWADDKVADFTSLGDSARKLDFVATGRSLVSLRAPGSHIDANYPAARVGADYLRGSGSSQAAAVTAAAAAIMLQNFPALTPDGLKGLLKSMARPVHSNIFMVDVYKTWNAYLNAPQTFKGVMAPQKGAASTGTGSLEAARGTSHISDNGKILAGENDIFGAFSTTTWAPASTRRTAWTGGTWMGRAWTGTTYVSGPGGLQSWSGRAWSGRAWSGRAWSSDVWAGVSWQGAGWL